MLFSGMKRFFADFREKIPKNVPLGLKPRPAKMRVFRQLRRTLAEIERSAQERPAEGAERNCALPVECS
jgi:hypothetical protein